MADTVAQLRIGPQDHGRRMTLDEFRDAAIVPGYRYELAKGVIEAVDVPGGRHFRMMLALDEQLDPYKVAHPEIVTAVVGGGESKIELPGRESERHPDRSIYLSAVPMDSYPWDKWTPAIVIELVSEGSEARQRDYVEKRDDYLAAGVLEYWIIDTVDNTMLALRRHGDQWREHRVSADAKWTTPLLPGFELDVAAVLAVP